MIVGNEARTRRRGAGGRDHLALRAAGAASPGEAAPSPEEAALDAAERARLLAALEQLPEQAREILACRYLLDLSERRRRRRRAYGSAPSSRARRVRSRS